MLTALIVEDEPLMREYLLFNLSSIHDQWITAACAKDGVEAMALLNDGVSGNLKYIFSCISHTNCNVND